MDFKDSVAVVTGGASGIGLALAQGAVARGARVVISDIRQDALDAAEAQLKAQGGDVLTLKVDVSRYEDVDAMADATIQRFGKANLIFNNAGIFASGLTWEVSLEEYNWVIDVNLKSVVHGIKAFVPRMIKQGDPCHVINTASGAGITVNPGFCTYSMTKHGVVALTEALWLDLEAEGITNIGATVVMPGVVQSKIMFPEKTGPDALQGELKNRLGNKTLSALEAFMRQAVDAGLPASELADMVYAAIAGRELYVLPNFNDEGSVAMSTAIATGRATGKNAYPEIVGGLLANLQAMET